MILNYKNWKKLHEQAEAPKVTGTTTTHERFPDPEDAKINTLFMSEFLPKLIPGREKLLVQDYSEKLKQLPDSDLQGVIEFYTSKGYKQPSDKIKKFQERLKQISGFETFINKSTSNPNEFADGTFGVATAKVLIGSFAANLDNYSKRNPNSTFADLSAANAKIQSNTSLAKQPDKIVAPSKVAGKTAEIEVGTQKIK